MTKKNVKPSFYESYVVRFEGPDKKIRKRAISQEQKPFVGGDAIIAPNEGGVKMKFYVAIGRKKTA